MTLIQCENISIMYRLHRPKKEFCDDLSIKSPSIFVGCCYIRCTLTFQQNFFFVFAASKKQFFLQSTNSSSYVVLKFLLHIFTQKWKKLSSDIARLVAYNVPCIFFINVYGNWYILYILNFITTSTQYKFRMVSSCYQQNLSIQFTKK